MSYLTDVPAGKTVKNQTIGNGGYQVVLGVVNGVVIKSGGKQTLDTSKGISFIHSNVCFT